MSNDWMKRATDRIDFCVQQGAHEGNVFKDVVRGIIEEEWKKDNEVVIPLELTDRLFEFQGPGNIVKLDRPRFTGAISVRDCLVDMLRQIDTGTRKMTKMVALVHYREKGQPDNEADVVGYHAAGPMNRLEVIGTCQNAASMFSVGPWGRGDN